MVRIGAHAKEDVKFHPAGRNVAGARSDDEKRKASSDLDERLCFFHGRFLFAGTNHSSAIYVYRELQYRTLTHGIAIAQCIIPTAHLSYRDLRFESNANTTTVDAQNAEPRAKLEDQWPWTSSDIRSDIGMAREISRDRSNKLSLVAKHSGHRAQDARSDRDQIFTGSNVSCKFNNSSNILYAKRGILKYRIGHRHALNTASPKCY
ncbi:hypothetical protein BKA63DRAFT_494910 [Paraphoma chrysanthemicola]|nr:hypothetical protein BKA63DRAFT_494910 [Paraphoma chrysanthemicola]